MFLSFFYRKFLTCILVVEHFPMPLVKRMPPPPKQSDYRGEDLKPENDPTDYRDRERSSVNDTGEYADIM
jgi:hypothetical protein